MWRKAEFSICSSGWTKHFSEQFQFTKDSPNNLLLLLQQITSRQLNDTLKQVFDSFHSRSVYLNSVKDTSQRPASAVMQGPPAVGMNT